VQVATRDIPIGGREHAVCFYEEDSELAETVGGYLADALGAGAVAVVIATEPHRRAFEDELDLAGADPARARREEALLWLDASARMAAFMPGGRIDGRAFRCVIGGVLRQAAESGRPICAHGEMVALLRDAGGVLGAIEIEELWNELMHDVQFPASVRLPPSIGVGPGGRGCPRPGLPRAFHGSGRGFEPVLRRLARARAARRLVANAVMAWGADLALVNVGQLVVSELATKAVLHVRTPFSVVARRHRTGLRISVRDSGALRPNVGDRGPSAPSGRGLRVVADPARGWGAHVTADGKTVCAELPA
jgi:hypothetical protein